MIIEIISTEESELTVCSLSMSNKQKEAEREAALNCCLEELEAKNKEALLLEKKVKELEDKLQVAVKVSSYFKILSALIVRFFHAHFGWS